MFDWLTFTAQIINFLILVWLLKRFLFAPISKAMDERESDLKSLSYKAQEKLKRAEEIKKQIEEENESLSKMKSEKLQELEAEIDSQRHKSILRIKNEIKELELSYKESLNKERRRLHNDFRRNIQKEILDIVRKILSDLANQDLESHIVQKFINEFNKGGKIDLTGLSNNPITRVLVNSTFELNEENKKAIENLIKQSTEKPLEIAFKTSIKPIAGIEVTVDGKKASWTIDDYLSNLDNSFLREL